MRYRTLGRTDLDVSVLGFGGTGAGLKNYIMQWNPAEEYESSCAHDALVRAIELGVNYFVTAPLYGSEELFGEVLQSYRKDIIQYQVESISEEILHLLLKPNGVLTGMQALKKEGLVGFIGFTAEAANGGVSRLIGTDEFDVMQIQYNLTFQNPYNPEKSTGVMFEAEVRNMGIVVMRSMTGGTFQNWMNLAAPNIADSFDVPKALLSFVLSNPLSDVALVDMRRPEWVEANCNTVDDFSSRIDLDKLYNRFGG